MPVKPRRSAALQDTQSAKLSFLNKVQQCFAVRKGLEGMLDLARDVFCKATEQVHELMATYREQHSLDSLKVGTCLCRWVPAYSERGSGFGRCSEESLLQAAWPGQPQVGHQYLHLARLPPGDQQQVQGCFG